MEDDPFVYSYFELSKGGKGCARNFSAVLLKSEYDMLISGMEALLERQQSSIQIETIEPLFTLHLMKDKSTYTMLITIEADAQKPRRIYKMICDEAAVKAFTASLRWECSHVKSPPKSP
ncbi:hypothetical protein P4T89_10015 [Bacillus nakamurai]|uniref:Uncharacterized protein n=1 Tax=Bacillus nakamurai TaxID=1793963 RepID=A0A150F2H1_9BACI|nr:hypothetical protein [Bacillus nakamurai]KXZ13068.1 hypothetical protein AXI58_05140 [Bacillus nakamurai]MED1227910.1 hypothetical protein [Bacillus nakamurai]